ncbi:MAG: hypothetical protein EHM42_11255 [Planctomycetaceae bacterium]|nr:MAG: hypothetical protein EHM42_11255 [Planctomycetaceae bacterium]
MNPPRFRVILGEPDRVSLSWDDLHTLREIADAAASLSLALRYAQPVQLPAPALESLDRLLHRVAAAEKLDQTPTPKEST